MTLPSRMTTLCFISTRAAQGSRSSCRQPIRAGSPFRISVPIGYDRSGDGNAIIVDLTSLQSSNVDVTVPASTDLKLDVNSLNIQVDGVTGQMVLMANSGSISVTRSTLNNASIVNDNTGAINVMQDTLSGPVTLSNNSGSITFNGSLEPGGKYQFKSNQRHL